MPYGDRSIPDLLNLLSQNMLLLEDEGAAAIIAACNTSCAVAEQCGWPASRVPVLDLIESAGIAVKAAGGLRIGVVATSATARSGSYARHIVARVPEAHVVEVAAPALVPLVERGLCNTPQSRQAVQDACAPLLGRIDTLVLGCTHYPLLAEDFRAVAGAGVTLVDPAEVHAERAVQLVLRHDIRAGTGSVECLTNGALEAFQTHVLAVVPEAHCTSAHVRR